MTPAELVALIEHAFTSAYPGDPWIRGSGESDEAIEDVAAFFGRTDWREIDAAFLDGYYTAPSFLSEVGFRFFLPAWLVADIRGELMTADPLFHLVHGFSELAVDLPEDGVSHRSGGPHLLGPRRYGAMTWEDASRHRLSVFCREEATAIVAYLEWRHATDALGLDRPRIDAALERFWRQRAESAPTREELDAQFR